MRTWDVDAECIRHLGTVFDARPVRDFHGNVAAFGDARLAGFHRGWGGDDPVAGGHLSLVKLNLTSAAQPSLAATGVQRQCVVRQQIGDGAVYLPG
jgi:hypothetical protein